MSNPTSKHAAVIAFLTHKVREALEHETTRSLGARAGVSHVTILSIEKGEWKAGRLDTVTGVAKAVGVDPDDLYVEAGRWARDNPESLKEFVPKGVAPTEPHVERDPRASTAQGSMRNYDEAERQAREEYPGVPEEAWIGARGLSGFAFPESASAEFVWQLAMDWLHVKRMRERKQ